MVETINELIEVVVRFKKGKILPLSFFWQGRDYPIKRTEFLYFDRQGEAKIYLFSVVGQEANYQLIFNSQTLVWKLNKVEVA